MDATVTLVSSDAKKFVVPVGVATMSAVIMAVLDDVDDDDDEDLSVTVHSFILQKIIDYCTYHYENDDDGDDQQLAEWDAKFVEGMGTSLLVEMTVVANYLNIKTMLEMLCKSLAEKINGKNPHEIRELFNIKNDFTDDEILEHQQENKWWR